MTHDPVQSDAPRRKVLIIAEAANPEWVSVPLVGWSLASALRDVADVHLVTQIRNKEAIERAGLKHGVDFTAIDSEAISRPVFNLAKVLRLGQGRGWTMVSALMNTIAYPYFERLVWQAFGARVMAGEFDLVHRVTPLSPTAQSSIAAKCARAKVPFVLGPLNGGVPWPKGFNAERLKEREYLSYVRDAYKVIPGRAGTLTSASAIITGSKHTQSEIPDRFAAKTTRIPENGIDPARFTGQTDQDLTPPLRGCFVGRLVPYKGPDMLIEAALPYLADGSLVLDIVGDGPMKADLLRMVDTHNVAHAVTFHGWLEHAQVQDVLRNANLLTFPSIREFGGGVVLEAMALGVVPVICDYAGPAELVDDTTGFKVPMGTRNEITQRLSQTLGQIIEAPAGLPDMASNARTRVESHYTWHQKARQIAEIYEWVLDPDAGDIPGPFNSPLARREAHHA